MGILFCDELLDDVLSRSQPGWLSPLASRCEIVFGWCSTIASEISCPWLWFALVGLCW